MSKIRQPHITTDEGNIVLLPFKFEICSCCSGHGKSSAYLGAYTSDEMADQGPDFFDEYMAGTYDRTCDACDGDGKAMVADYSRMTAQQIQTLEDDERFDAEDAAYSEAERRMGC
ncbi:hypothetical protein [Methylobacterium thuringiense]|uniref:Uncharacterized protein n=1 Tax=Methylobacterium thuringiense TaxID=1003091 RepID=A0ABQ4TGW6_9HYPH|nr:hypothetical protein [Methylobacterium thuringiense]GJE54541.1 hypothetical protein EKPJFOCH_1019 [Methylobacterium thuringiense]